MKAEIGDEVGLYYDADAPVLEGDFLVTRTGRCYKVVKLRIQQRGQNKGRYHLRCVVSEKVEKSAKVHSLCWYPRD